MGEGGAGLFQHRGGVFEQERGFGELESEPDQEGASSCSSVLTSFHRIAIETLCLALCNSCCSSSVGEGLGLWISTLRVSMRLKTVGSNLDSFDRRRIFVSARRF